MSRKPRTAAELMQELQADSDHVSRQRSRDQRQRQRAKELRAAEAPLVDDLREVGVDVASVWELVNSADPYPAALPVLMDHLSRSYPEPTREGIARALAVSGEAALLWEEVRQHYEREPPSTGAKDGLAVALAALADDQRIPQLVELIRDERHGESRVFFVRPLNRSGRADATAALDDLAGDPQVAQEIQIARSGR